MIRILLADDQTLIRAGFRALLDAEPDMEVVAEAGTGRDAVRLAARDRPDVILMDIRMPDGDGLTATRRSWATQTSPARAHHPHHLRAGRIHCRGRAGRCRRIPGQRHRTG